MAWPLPRHFNWDFHLPKQTRGFHRWSARYENECGLGVYCWIGESLIFFFPMLSTRSLLIIVLKDSEHDLWSAINDSGEVFEA